MPNFNGLKRDLSNLVGWRTDRKIIIFESDDWGSIRMPSQTTYRSLNKKGLELDKGDYGRYNSFDTLASSEDLACLFDVLSKVKDSNNNRAVFTAVALVANPNFEKIAENHFTRYEYEPFIDTLKRYERHDAFDFWKKGISEKLFIPQFHGREHLNVATWMRALRAGDQKTRIAFDYGFWGFPNANISNVSYQAAFDLEERKDIDLQKVIIEDGVKLFRHIHKYSATFFVPPNGPINNSLEFVAAKGGIKYISTAKLQKEVLGNGKKRTIFHYIGQKNKSGQYYITRNCFFEPSLKDRDWVDSCLAEIASAFRWKKPAVISSHRVNYIGGLSKVNRSYGLLKLAALLKQIVKVWPDTEFMTSDQLGELIKESYEL